MRSFEQRRAEVFRRSADRIKTQRRVLKKVCTVCVSFCLLLWIGLTVFLPMINNEQRNPIRNNSSTSGNTNGTGNAGEQGSFSFSFSWQTDEVGSYDSATGLLVKGKDSTCADCVISLSLSEKQKSAIWDLISDLRLEQYPDQYDPHGGGASAQQTMTLVLTVRNDGRVKTVRAEDVLFSYVSSDVKAQKFLDACSGILDILTATDEWKNLGK